MKTLLLGAAALALLSAPAAAQAPADSLRPNGLEKGATSLLVEVGSASNTIALHHMVGARTSLGVSVAASRTSFDGGSGDDDGADFSAYSAGLHLRHHLSDLSQAIVPFVEVSGSVGRQRNDEQEFSDEARGTLYAATASAGLEWFPVRRVSIGGSAGIRVQRQDVTIVDGAGGEIEQSATSIGTLTSSVQLRLFV
jgi:hypothetical protein